MQTELHHILWIFMPTLKFYMYILSTTYQWLSNLVYRNTCCCWPPRFLKVIVRSWDAKFDVRIWPSSHVTDQKLEKADSDVLRIIFIQTIATCQKVKKADLRCFDNLIHNGQMPESEKSGHPTFWAQLLFRQLLHTRNWKKADSDNFRRFENNFYSDIHTRSWKKWTWMF